MIGFQRNSLEIAEYNLLENTLKSMGLPIGIPTNLKTQMIMKHMAFDKKKKNGKNHFVLLDSIGKSCISNKLTNTYISTFVKTFQS